MGVRGWLVFAVVIGVGVRALGAVKVTKAPAEVTRRTFDPQRPPAEMPPLKPGEAAFTEFYFDCTTNVSYRVREGSPNLIVSDVSVSLRLKVVIWLPRGVTPKLTAHEEGHRRIAERTYEHAEDAAETEARKLDGAVLTRGKGESENDVVSAASKKVCTAYVRGTGDYTQRVGDAYDELTNHGRNRLTEDEAIRKAFERCDGPAATPSTEPAKKAKSPPHGHGGAVDGQPAAVGAKDK